MTDDRIATQNGSVGIDRHIVPNGGMPLGSTEALTAPGGQATQGHALIDLHALTNNGGFTDYDTSAVVDEEMLSDGGAGMDVDAGDAVAYSVMIRGIMGTPKAYSTWARRYTVIANRPG